MKKIFVCLLFIFILTDLSAQIDMSATFSYKVGDVEVVLLAENQGAGKATTLIDATPEMLRNYMPDGAYPTAVNAFLLRMAEQIILVDAGLGTRLFDNIQSLGLTPEQVDKIVITHMHGDHIGGLLRNEVAAFPHAELYLPQPEYAYWMNDTMMYKMPENRRGGFLNVRKTVAAYEGHVHFFRPDDLHASAMNAIVPGLFGIDAYGHTPGHTMYLIKSGNDRLLIWGDIAHAMAIQMPHPEIAVTYDVDPIQAIASRKTVLEFVTAHKIPVAGMHVAYPGIGSVTENGKGGYRFQPAVVKELVQQAVHNQLKAYPESRLQDFYKNFFQDYFGPGHIIVDTSSAAAYLRNELAGLPDNEGAAFEPTGWQGCFYRVNLSSVKDRLVPYDVFFDAFVESADYLVQPTVDRWQEQWREIMAIIDDMRLSLPDYDADKEKIRQLLIAGNYVMHHSAAYNAHYKPHYRIIHQVVFDRDLRGYLE